ncbi:MAG: YncE family protein [Kiloniellales bacterium]
MLRLLSTRVLAAALASFAFGTSAVAQQPPNFEGRYIAAISDGDMRAYAYIDGLIGEKRGPDELAMIGLPLEAAEPTARIGVSNSVINPVYSIAASPDGNTIFVAETHTAQEAGDRLIGDLQPGTTLRAIDVSDLANPSILDQVEVGTRPLGVSVSPDGQTLVLATRTPGSPLTFVSYRDGGFGEARQFALQNVSPMTELPDLGQMPHHAEWHPSEDVVAVTLNLRNQVQFYRVDRDADGNVEELAQWGNSVATAKWPMSGKFSRDGRFFVSNDLQWGPDVGPHGNGSYAPPSQLTAIRLADVGTEAPRHYVMGGVSVPQHAESLAFSNDGSMIVTLNLGQTWIPEGEPDHSLSSLSLVTFDNETGLMRHAGDWEMAGILPEGVAFDASDRYVVAGVFEYEGPEPRRSALEFWSVKREAGRLPRLVPTGFTIETGPGAHSLIVVND